MTLLSSGSEVSVAVAAQALLHADDIPSRVVSVPSFELLERQDAAARDTILGVGTVRVAVEATVSFGWDRLVGPDGVFVGMNSFGASAPADDLYTHFGITAESLAETAKRQL